MAPNIGTSQASDLENADPDFSVDNESTEGVDGGKETEWMNDKYAQWLGYYKGKDQYTPDFQGVINTIADYTIGKGFNADEKTTKILKKINGFGKDTFDEIIKGMLITNLIGGDSYSEIIRDKAGRFINLKPLDPATMKHVANSKGRLKRFEQVSKIVPSQTIMKFKLKEIFYLPRNRTADEIHGTSLTERLEKTILSINEATADMKILMHRHIKPFAIYELNTDDPVKIAAFKAQKDAASKGAENIYVAMGSVKVTPVVMHPGAIQQAREWITQQIDELYRGANVPKVLVGDSSKNAEAGVKMEYFSFQQRTESEQLKITEQIELQLKLKVTLPKPASLEKDIQKTQGKEGSAIKKSDTTATLSGRK